MKRGLLARWSVPGVVVPTSAVLIVLMAGRPSGQPAGVAAQRPEATDAARQVMAEEVFKNVQLLRGIPVGEFWDTMGFIAAAVGANCTDCHVEESLIDLERFADDTPRKRRARQMIAMVNAINQTHFGGARVVTCNSCHNGGNRPEPVPSLLRQYSLPLEDPNLVEPVPDAGSPPASETLERYVQAVGGTERLSALTSFVASGTYRGYDTYDQKVPYEIFVKAPNQRTVVVHTQNGINTTVFDGSRGWVAAVDRPVPLLPLAPGGELDGAKLEADLAFPAGISQALTGWRADFPITAIGDRTVHVLQGTGATGARMKLYFDSESGLLARVLRYTTTMIGVVPTQIDYDDYREVAGVKMPFKRIVTWTSGQATIELIEVQPNVPIIASRFTQPAPAVLTSQGLRP
ncbi:MAG: photosynthetic reaction center cytochrome c subunit [Acidobacteria bacterium]|nr:photosynthetic reaction center cytochrome c subunit [Acidobacteriota bacterium]